MVRIAKDFGQTSIAITDHGVLSGVPDFYRAARAEKINPIIGCEMYVVPSTTAVGFGPKGNLRDRRNFHMTLLAKNAEGYKEMVKLSSWSHTRETYFYNPRIDYDMLRKVDTSNLICLSGCVMGEVQETFLEAIKHIVAIECATAEQESKAKQKGYEVVRKWAWPRWSKQADAKLRAHPDFTMALEAATVVMKTYRSMFPEGQYFYEVMDHGFVLEEWAHRYLYQQSQRYGIPAVVTNDSHYGPVEHKELHDLLMAMQWKEQFCGSTDPKRLDICHEEELYERLKHLLTAKQFAEAVANTAKIADMCADTYIEPFEQKTYRIPTFIGPDGDPVSQAGKMVKELARPRLEHLCKMYPEQAHEYRARLRFELSVIKRFGLYHYFLIVQDVVNWAKKQKILVGAGRGSAAGSLLAYCLHITEIDPLQHGLYFERFLSTDRMSMPDFDTDFQSRHIERVMQYLADKYGHQNVERLCAYDKLRPKSMLQNMIKALGLMSHAEIVKLTGSLEDDNTRTDAEYIDEWWNEVQDERLLQIVKSSNYDIKAFTKELFQLPVSVSAHAAAVVIGDDKSDLSEWVPRQFVPSSKRSVTQFDMNQIESMGFVKLDVLSVGTLDTVADCIERIGHNPFQAEIERQGFLSYDDPKTYELISSGHTDGLFQLSGGTAKQVIKQIGGCHSFEDIVAVMSLGRPGAVRFATKYRRNREADWNDVELVNESLKILLRKSYGVVLFQEDVMAIVWHLGMSAEDLDVIMKAVKKKDYALFDEVQPSFMQHARKAGWSDDEAKNVWDQIRDYAGYGFNRCLSGDTVVYRASGNQHASREVTIKELYEIWHGPNTPAKKAYRRRGLSILALKDGRIRPGRCVGVHNNGMKEVYQVTLANGMSITATDNHRHLTTNGWVMVKDLAIGDEVVVDDGCEYACETTGAGVDWAKRSNERRLAADGRMRPSRGGHYSSLAAVTRLLPQCCERCGTDQGRLERAHLNHDRTDNRRQNVLRLCNSCHKQHDWDTGKRRRRYEKGRLAGSSAVISIEHMGAEMTYDLEMEDEGHNFVANGIVTHNSHAASYADLAYKTAYLKANYPAYFIASKMKQFSTNTDAKKKRENLPALVRDARRVGVRVYPPSVNKSEIHYHAISPTKIRAGLADINGVGITAAKEIINKRPFTASDFTPPYVETGPRGGKYERGATLKGVDKSRCNSGALLAMAYAGAMPGIDIENLWEAERELLYCNLSKHPNQEMLQAVEETVLDPVNLDKLFPKEEEGYKAEDVRCGGIITRLHEHQYTIKQGNLKGQRGTMAFLDLELGKHDFSVVVFGDLWGELHSRATVGRIILARGRVDWSEQRGLSFITESADIYQ